MAVLLKNWMFDSRLAAGLARCALTRRYWSRTRRLAGVVALTLGMHAQAARAGDQPQWGRAWSRNMVSDERGLAASFDPQTGRNVLWTARLGSETHSSPVVAGGRVYVGTNNGNPATQGIRATGACSCASMRRAAA